MEREVVVKFFYFFFNIHLTPHLPTGMAGGSIRTPTQGTNYMFLIQKGKAKPQHRTHAGPVPPASLTQSHLTPIYASSKSLKKSSTLSQTMSLPPSPFNMNFHFFLSSSFTHEDLFHSCGLESPSHPNTRCTPVSSFILYSLHRCSPTHSTRLCCLRSLFPTCRCVYLSTAHQFQRMTRPIPNLPLAHSLLRQSFHIDRMPPFATCGNKDSRQPALAIRSVHSFHCIPTWAFTHTNGIFSCISVCLPTSSNTSSRSLVRRCPLPAAYLTFCITGFNSDKTRTSTFRVILKACCIPATSPSQTLATEPTATLPALLLSTCQLPPTLPYRSLLPFV